jgi:hypothetical protein
MGVNKNKIITEALEDIRLIRSALQALVETCDATTWRIKDNLKCWDKKMTTTKSIGGEK